MIEVREVSTPAIKKAYDARSWLYSKIVAPREHKYHLVAIEQANIKIGETILEVAVGPGMTFIELAKKTGKDATIYGVDLSTSMLQLTRKRLENAGFSKVDLREADCRELPFEDDTFDLLYNGYMLDLIPLNEFPHVIEEFKRVLKPGGRLVLLNTSKKDDGRTRLEALYQTLPETIVLYVFGLCRPVLMEQSVKDAGLENVSRIYMDSTVSSEIVTAYKK